MGAKPISSFYERNLDIFAASHEYFLRVIVQMHPDTKLVETLDYLWKAMTNYKTLAVIDSFALQFFGSRSRRCS